MNTGKMLVALLAAAMSLSVAPMAAASHTANCAIPSDFSDRSHELTTSYPGEGAVLGSGTIDLDDAIKGHAYFIPSDATDTRDLSVSGQVQYRVVENTSGCTEVQGWTDATADPLLLDLPTGKAMFVLIKPLAAEDPNANDPPVPYTLEVTAL